MPPAPWPGAAVRDREQAERAASVQKLMLADAVTVRAGPNVAIGVVSLKMPA
ncbi:hypothetical protein D3C72_2574390 [compost metagenome]